MSKKVLVWEDSTNDCRLGFGSHLAVGLCLFKYNLLIETDFQTFKKDTRVFFDSGENSMFFFFPKAFLQYSQRLGCGLGMSATSQRCAPSLTHNPDTLFLNSTSHSPPPPHHLREHKQQTTAQPNPHRAPPQPPKQTTLSPITKPPP